jgi:hypothetical protein
MSLYATPVLFFLRLRAAALVAALVCVAAGSPLTAAEKPPAVGTQAKDFELPNLACDKTKLSTLTADGPVVLVILQIETCFGDVRLGRISEDRFQIVNASFFYPNLEPLDHARLNVNPRRISAR